MDTLNVHIVPSTHWDREWYLTQRRFQFRLVKLMDGIIKLLKRDDYPSFLLDGQCIMLEDYLEIRPEKQQELRELVSEGKLIIGPWYVVPDFFIPSGESIIKNLEIGREISQFFGQTHEIGYTPDSFGLVSQIPQIFEQFGLKGVFFSRGYHSEHKGIQSESIWEGKDGSRIPAIYESYNSAVFLSYPDIWRNIELVQMDKEEMVSQALKLLQQNSETYTTKHRLWIVGIDHMEPRDTLPDMINVLSERIKGVNFVHSTVQNYFARISMEKGNLPYIYGEQRGPCREHFVLGNTLSSRVDIKKMNRECENQLQYWADPLAAYAASAYSQSFETARFSKTAWKLLVQNHAHDSICSCNSDDTNMDVEARLRHVKQMAEDITECHLGEIGSQIKLVTWMECKEAVVMVYNASSIKRNEVVKGCVRVPREMQGDRFIVRDEKGRIVNDAVVKVRATKRIDLETMKMSDEQLLNDTTRYPIGYYEQEDMYTFLDICWMVANVPPQGYKCYTIEAHDVLRTEEYREQESLGSIFSKVQKHFDGMENEFYRLRIHDTGTVDLLLKESKQWYEDILDIESQADDGDTYTFSPLLGDLPLSIKCIQPDIRCVENNDWRVCFELKWIWPLPECIMDRKLRSAVLKPVNLCCSIAISTGSRIVECKCTVDNSVKDHRMRVVFKFPEHFDKVASDTPFDLVQRPVMPDGEFPEISIHTMPFRNVISLYEERRKDRTVLLLSRTSQEFEPSQSVEGSKVAVTLFRAVSAVYRTVLATKDESAFGEGTRWWSKDAQCLKRMEFEFGIGIYPTLLSPGEIINEGICFNLPLKPAAIVPQNGSLPCHASFLDLQPEKLVLSKVAVGRNTERGVMVRFFNPEDYGILASLTAYMPIQEAYEVSLTGERIRKLEVLDKKAMLCPAEAGRIKTIEMVM